jgi:hypothetical protein
MCVCAHTHLEANDLGPQSHWVEVLRHANALERQVLVGGHGRKWVPQVSLPHRSRYPTGAGRDMPAQKENSRLLTAPTQSTARQSPIMEARS